MANRKSPASPSIPAQARLLFTQLSTQYADATEAEWDELADHMRSRMDLLASGSPKRRELLETEFAKVRTATLAAQHGRRVLAALAAGEATLVRAVDADLEEWAVTVDSQTLRLFVPADLPGDAAVDTARAALLTGRCPSCTRTARLVGESVVAEHNSRCPAKPYAD